MSAPITLNLQPTTSPICIGMIMDGNRRWARERGLPTLAGHRQGYEKLKEVVGWCRDAGIEHLVVYALSTENWKRAQEEVSYLMDLFRMIVSEQVSALQEEGVAVHFVGDLVRFPEDLQASMTAVHTKNKAGAQRHLWIAASYGGRAELLAAVNQLLKQRMDEVDEAHFTQALWTAGMPDPDIVIRTGGEQRLSNFLPWQSTYAELFFTKTFWPAFTQGEFAGVLNAYKERERRHGV